MKMCFYYINIIYSSLYTLNYHSAYLLLWVSAKKELRVKLFLSLFYGKWLLFFLLFFFACSWSCFNFLYYFGFRHFFFLGWAFAGKNIDFLSAGNFFVD